MTSDQPTPVVFAELTPARAIAALAIGVAAGLLLVVIPYAFAAMGGLLRGEAFRSSIFAARGFGASLTLLFPMVQGFAMAAALGPRRYQVSATAFLSVALVVIELFGATVFIHEGVICLIILSPMIMVLVLFGAVLGRVAARRVGRSLQVSLVPLIVLAVFAEATGPRPDYGAAVSDSVTINAPPDYVWRYVVQYPENNAPPEYWLWRIGLPEPIQSVAEAPRVDAARACRFSKGIAFEERITELVPNERLTFDVTRQPDHPEINGHFSLERGQITLTPNADGSTTITGTSWYRLYVRPAAYFDWWAADIIRQVHFRVLNHMKALAERDYRAAQSPT